MQAVNKMQLFMWIVLEVQPFDHSLKTSLRNYIILCISLL